VNTIKVDIVSAERALYSGQAEMLVATAIFGEVGIMPNHTPFLAMLKPGQIRVIKQIASDEEEIFYISGGILEVQPLHVTVLADTGIRAHDLDEAAALEAKHRAERLLSESKTDFDYAAARVQLANAAAQLLALQKLRDRRK
jgi:F-type H+-transporting ATPase subunit epsilon